MFSEASSGTHPAFNQKAHSYEAHAFVQRDAADWLAEWLPEIEGPQNCLELGAGTGMLTRHLAERFDHIEASDLWHEMLKVCRQQLPKLNYSRRDAWQPQKDQECWDIVASSSLLQWAPQPVPCLMQWRDLLRPNGRILTSLFVEPSLPEMVQTLGGESPLRWHKDSDWKGYCEEAGLKVVRIETDTRRYNYESAMHFWKSLHGTGATVSQRMSPSQMIRLFRDYEAKFSDRDGVYATWTFCRFELMRAE